MTAVSFPSPVRWSRWEWLRAAAPSTQVATVLVATTVAAGWVAWQAVRALGWLIVVMVRGYVQSHRHTRRWGGACFGVTRHVHRGRRQPVWWSARILWVPVGRQH